MRLREVARFEVIAATLSATEAALRDAGHRGDELFLFWSGSITEDGSFNVRTLHRPRQTCHRSALGLSVRIDGSALHKQARWLVEHREILGVQIHSHPDTAYHSEADDDHATVTLTGAVSIVVPDFGRDSIFGPRARVFRLSERGWKALDPDDVDLLFRVAH